MTPEIERAAQTLREKLNSRFGFNPLSELAVDATIIVFKALAEPSDAMVETAAAAMYEDSDEILAPNWIELPNHTKQIWRNNARGAMRAAMAKALGARSAHHREE